jgi:hypothetical protein
MKMLRIRTFLFALLLLTACPADDSPLPPGMDAGNDAGNDAGQPPDAAPGDLATGTYAISDWICVRGGFAACSAGIPHTAQNRLALELDAGTWRMFDTRNATMRTGTIEDREGACVTLSGLEPEVMDAFVCEGSGGLQGELTWTDDFNGERVFEFRAVRITEDDRRSP